MTHILDLINKTEKILYFIGHKSLNNKQNSFIGSERTKNRTHTLVLKFGLTNILVLVNITKERIHICY